MKGVAVVTLVLAGTLVAAAPRADDGPGVRVVPSITHTTDGDKELPNRFNFGTLYSVELNVSIQKADQLKKGLLAALGKHKGLRDKIVFGQFASGRAAPKVVELNIGSKVPAEVGQAIIAELLKVEGLAVTLSAMKKDEEFGNTQRVYIGSLVVSGRKPFSQAKLKSLLRPRLGLKKFHELIEPDKEAKGPCPEPR